MLKLALKEANPTSLVATDQEPVLMALLRLGTHEGPVRSGGFLRLVKHSNCNQTLQPPSVHVSSSENGPNTVRGNGDVGMSDFMGTNPTFFFGGLNGILRASAFRLGYEPTADPRSFSQGSNESMHV